MIKNTFEIFNFFFFNMIKEKKFEPIKMPLKIKAV